MQNSAGGVWPPLASYIPTSRSLTILYYIVQIELPSTVRAGGTFPRIPHLVPPVAIKYYFILFYFLLVGYLRPNIFMFFELFKLGHVLFSMLLFAMSGLASASFVTSVHVILSKWRGIKPALTRSLTGF